MGLCHIAMMLAAKEYKYASVHTVHIVHNPFMVVSADGRRREKIWEIFLLFYVVIFAWHRVLKRSACEHLVSLSEFHASTKAQCARLASAGIRYCTVTFMIGAGTFRWVRLVPCMMQHFTVHRVMWALTPFYRDLCFRIFCNKKKSERICLLVFRSKPTRPTSFRREYQGISLDG